MGGFPVFVVTCQQIPGFHGIWNTVTSSELVYSDVNDVTWLSGLDNWCDWLLSKLLSDLYGFRKDLLKHHKVLVNGTIWGNGVLLKVQRKVSFLELFSLRWEIGFVCWGENFKGEVLLIGQNYM